MHTIKQTKVKFVLKSWVNISETDMEQGSSPLQMKHLCYTTARRRVFSSDESDNEYCRAEEVSTRSDCSTVQTYGTSLQTKESDDKQTGQGLSAHTLQSGSKKQCNSGPSEVTKTPATHDQQSDMQEQSSTSSQAVEQLLAQAEGLQSEMLSPTSTPSDGKQGVDADVEPIADEPDDPGLIIDMTHSVEMAWDSDVDSNSSGTSTPGYKRGIHNTEIKQQAVQEIIQDSQGQGKLAAPHRDSLHILADAMMENWPKGDNMCHLDYNLGWSLNQWLSALRAEMVRIRSDTVVLYLEKVATFEDVPP